MSNSKAVGVAYSDPEFTTCYASEEIGYTSQAQGVVVQQTNKSIAVDLNKPMGRIIMNNANLAANTNVTFRLNNTLIGENDAIILTVAGGVAAAGTYNVFASRVQPGGVSITLRNITNADLAEAVEITFCIIHGQ